MPPDQLEVGVLEAPAGGPQLDDEPPGGGAPAGQGRHELGVRRGTLEPIAAAVAVGTDGHPGPDRAERPFQRRHLVRAERPVQAEAEPRRHAGLQLRRSPGGDDPARDQDVDPVGQPLDVGQVVAGHQDRGAIGAQVRDDRPGRGTSLRIHPRRRFVEDHDLGSTDEREREPESLALAAGQPPVAGPCHRGQPDQLEQLVRVTRIGVEAAVLAERLARLGTRVDAAALEHQPDPRPERPAADRRIDAQDPRRPPSAAR